VVDQFQPLRALVVSDLAAFHELYWERAPSAQGNRQAAELLARAIDRTATAPPPSAAVTPPAAVKKQ
jgi:hypothetical protein